MTGKTSLRRTVMTLFLAMLYVSGSWADEVTAQQAQEQALDFLMSHETNSGRQRRAQGTMPQLKLQGQVSGLYVFNVEDNGGFVIVSNDDRTIPILGFSEKGSLDPDNMPSNMKAWLQGYADEIAWLAGHGQTITGPKKARQKVGSHSTDAIAPLITTTWNQDAPYNNLCPKYDGTNKAATGCVATAMAQVMKYHEWPTSATQPIPGYTSPSYGLSLSSLPATTFDWANMKDDYSLSYTAAEGNAVATLMQYCGYSVQMNYGPESGSNTDFVAEALKTYFAYNTETTKFVMRSYYTSANWADLIYHELANGRPVVYGGMSSGGGHEFVCDGYKYEDGTDFFHINWGWGGQSDNYYVLSALDPDQQGIGGSTSTDGYHYGQDAVIGIQKAGSTGTVLDIPTNTIKLGLVSLSFTPSTIALGESVDIIITIKNHSSDDYDGDLYLLVNGGIGQGDMFRIASGATQDCVINFTPTEAGEYTLGVVYPGATGGYYGWDDQGTLTVTDQTPADLAVSDITSETATISWTNIGNAIQWNLRSRPLDITVDDLSSLSDWRVADQDKDGHSWNYFTSGGIDNSACLASPSNYDGTSLDSRNWLITPEFTFGGSISFYAWGDDEHFTVYYTTPSSNGTYYSLSDEITTTNEPTQYAFDLSSFSCTGRIAIIHSNSSGHTSESFLFVDDFKFTCPGSWTLNNNVVSPYRLTGMTAKTTYEVQAQATNANGGFWSSSLVFSTTDNTIELANNASNDDLISMWDGLTATVTLTGRTLYKDNEWNTLCLPFDVTLAGSPLEGADVRTLSNVSRSGSTLTLNFTEKGDVTSLTAGTPYIIKWGNGANLTESDLVFTNVVISKTANDFTSSDGKVQFRGTYAPISFDGEDKSILFVGAGNKLYWPLSGATIGAQRGYFQLMGITAEMASIKEFVMGFGEDDADGIGLTPALSKGEGDWYDLSGRRIAGKPNMKGIYVNGGRKVSVK